MRKLSFIRKAVRLLTVMMLVCMLASASVAALAANTPTLTVLGPEEGETYTYQEDLKVTMSVKLDGAFPDNEGKVITFKVNGMSYRSMTDASGVASYTLYGLGSAEYIWFASYAGDSDNDPARTDFGESKYGTFFVKSGEVSVTFTGDDGGPTKWIVDGVTKYPSNVVGVKDLSDIFGDQAKEMAPGTSASTSIELKNSSRVYYYTFYIQARPLDRSASKVVADNYFNGANFGKKDHPLAKSGDLSQELLATIDAVVTFKATGSTREAREIYSGKLLGGTRAELYSSGGAWLGTLGPSQSGTVTITIKLPDDLEEEFQNALCDCRWAVIVSDRLRDPPREQPEEPEVEVPEVEPPLGDVEPPPETPDISSPPTDIDIGEEDVPKTGVAVDTGAKMVQTGGIRTFALPLIIVLILLCALLAVTYMKRRNEKEGKAAE